MAPHTPATGYAAATRAALVPPRPPRTVEPADGFVRVEQRFTLGLPHRFRLDDELEAVLLLPTGLANEWRDAAGDTPVTTGAAERTPHEDGDLAEDLAVGALDRPPARLAIRSAGEVIGVVPLVAGGRTLVSAAGGAVLAEIEIVDWDVRAGAVRGPGDTVSRLVVSWRRADRAVDQFSVPPAPRRVLVRLLPLYRMESDLGLLLMVPTHWSKAKRVVVRP